MGKTIAIEMTVKVKVDLPLSGASAGELALGATFSSSGDMLPDVHASLMVPSVEIARSNGALCRSIAESDSLPG